MHTLTRYEALPANIVAALEHVPSKVPLFVIDPCLIGNPRLNEIRASLLSRYVAAAPYWKKGGLNFYAIVEKDLNITIRPTLSWPDYKKREWTETPTAGQYRVVGRGN